MAWHIWAGEQGSIETGSEAEVGVENAWAAKTRLNVREKRLREKDTAIPAWNQA